MKSTLNRSLLGLCLTLATTVATADTSDKQIALSNNYAGNSWRQAMLRSWEKVTGQAVIPMEGIDELKPPYRIFDACIWKKGDLYYSLAAGTLPDGPGGKRLRANFLWKSLDLANWEYMHPFVEKDFYSRVGDDGACPYFWPIGDKHILAHFSHTRGGKYLLGDYDTNRDKFVVTDGGDFNFGAYGPCGVHAPSACS